jgi:hypothetical protein
MVPMTAVFKAKELKQGMSCQSLIKNLGQVIGINAVGQGCTPMAGEANHCKNPVNEAHPKFSQELSVNFFKDILSVNKDCLESLCQAW